MVPSTWETPLLMDIGDLSGSPKRVQFTSSASVAGSSSTSTAVGLAPSWPATMQYVSIVAPPLDVGSFQSQVYHPRAVFGGG